MIIVIPLGGIGSRFKKNGYKTPKALIKVFGKPIIFWLIESLNVIDKTLIYIPYNKEYVKYRFEDILKKNFPLLNFKFFILENNTRGAAETLNISLRKLDCNDQSIISLDSDNFYMTNILKLWDKQNSVLVFNDNSKDPIYSYVKINNNNEVIDIIEKEKISDLACCGGYAFNSYKQLIDYTQLIIDNDIRQKNEFYTSTVIKAMIKDNNIFNVIQIQKKDFVCIGTPLQLRHFYNSYPKLTCNTMCNNIKEMRICFDLDNTLVTFPKINGDYTSVEPIKSNIDYLRYLKNFGHTIIIFTARRMKTHKGNVGKLMADIGKITFDTLEKFNIPYDEIYFGKPQADVYIDDLALNCYDDMEKDLGFYRDSIKPRDFNSLNNHCIEVYRKSSEDLSGEIFYYTNLPNDIKDMFPILINYDINNKWYEIEKIYGLTASIYYTSELLSYNVLETIINSLRRIYMLPVETNNIDIYANYGDKLQKRYSNYDYSSFSGSDIIFNELMDFFKEYKSNKKGKCNVIHGDPVLTNILINEHNKIKFIDMRGSIGSELSIYGDWLYDWAKLYQSLIGYDHILLNKDIDIEYQEKMISFFKTKFLVFYSNEDFNNLKMITKSLIFTLIPLHNNDNCNKFYNLLHSKHLT